MKDLTKGVVGLNRVHYTCIACETAEREEGSEEDIASAVAAEVEQLRGAGGKEGRRFQSVITGANHVVFIHTREPVEPCALVHHMLSQLLTGAVRKSRYVRVVAGYTN